MSSSSSRVYTVCRSLVNRPRACGVCSWRVRVACVRFTLDHDADGTPHLRRLPYRPCALVCTDLASLDRRVHRKMLELCAPPRPPCTDGDLMSLLHNESWRLDLFAAYRAHLEELMLMWRRCSDQRRRSAPPLAPP